MKLGGPSSWANTETEKNAIIARESAAIDFMLIPLVIKRLEV